MILAGSGVRWEGAPEAINRFIDATGVPVVTIDMARGAVPDDHPLCFGPVWTGLKHADLVIVCGAKLDYRLQYGGVQTINPDAKLVRIDYSDADAETNRSIDVDIAGDIGAVLSQMSEITDTENLPCYDDWVNECKSYTESHRNKLAGDISSKSVPIHPLRLCSEIRDFLDRDATIVVDGGDTTVFGKAGLKSYNPGHWLDVGPLWCIGVGVPFGIAAKLARPDGQVLLLSGDGSFGYGVFEYNTAIRHNIPIVSVVSNDAAWGMIKHDQKDAYGEGGVTGTELGITRYDKIVEALGGYGEYVERPDEIAPALKRAFASGLPACINVKVDPSVSSRYVFT
jgi:acetolactate synthase-1/2/3 large subunit